MATDSRRDRDYYEVLGVDEQASRDEIVAAFRRRARQVHPDISDANEASARMRDTLDAYHVLSDTARRAEYDETRRTRPSPTPRRRGVRIPVRHVAAGTTAREAARREAERARASREAADRAEASREAAQRADTSRGAAQRADASREAAERVFAALAPAQRRQLAALLLARRFLAARGRGLLPTGWPEAWPLFPGGGQDWDWSARRDWDGDWL